MNLFHPVTGLGLKGAQYYFYVSWASLLWKLSHFQMPDAEKCDNVSMAFVLKCHLLMQQHLELALK